MYRCHVGPCGLLGLLGLLIRPTPGCVNHVANRHQNPVFSQKTGFWCHYMMYSKLWKCHILAPISSLVYSEPDFGANIWHMSYIGTIFQTIENEQGVTKSPEMSLDSFFSRKCCWLKKIFFCKLAWKSAIVKLDFKHRWPGMPIIYLLLIPHNYFK